ncbi:MAG: 30S ribosomal protein S17 [Bacilli bacterium]|nr:30S ribosomal protein S17 [Bacilli bacterium]
MERKVQARRAIQGVVVSDKNDKTIVVLVETHRKHAKYGKRVKYGKKFYAHDELNEAKVGDTVTIMETRKLSATKRFRLVSIDKKAVLSIKEAEAELKEEVVVEAKEEAPVAEESKVAVVEEVAEKPAAKKAPAKKAASKKAEAEEEK